MNADQVRAYVAAKWPEALQSPAARLMAAASAMATIEASNADEAIELAETIQAATAHARECLDASDGWDVETLGHNIQSEFGPALTADECDDVARQAIAIWAQPADRGRFAEFSDSEIGPRAPATTKVTS